MTLVALGWLNLIHGFGLWGTTRSVDAPLTRDGANYPKNRTRVGLFFSPPVSLTVSESPLMACLVGGKKKPDCNTSLPCHQILRKCHMLLVLRKRG